MRERALVLQRPGEVAWDRQVAVCLNYADRRGYQPLTTIARSDAAAVYLIRLKQADLVLVAHHLPGDPVLVGQLESVGGRLEYCRGGRLPHRRQGGALVAPGHTTDELVLKAGLRGSTAEQIEAVLGVPLERVKQILRRLRPPS